MQTSAVFRRGVLPRPVQGVHPVRQQLGLEMPDLFTQSSVLLSCRRLAVCRNSRLERTSGKLDRCRICKFIVISSQSVVYYCDTRLYWALCYELLYLFGSPNDHLQPKSKRLILWHSFITKTSITNTRFYWILCYELFSSPKWAITTQCQTVITKEQIWPSPIIKFDS